jgi:hypothetical protein
MQIIIILYNYSLNLPLELQLSRPFIICLWNYSYQKLMAASRASLIQLDTQVSQVNRGWHYQLILIDVINRGWHYQLILLDVILLIVAGIIN